MWRDVFTDRLPVKQREGCNERRRTITPAAHNSPPAPLSTWASAGRLGGIVCPAFIWSAVEPVSDFDKGGGNTGLVDPCPSPSDVDRRHNTFALLLFAGSASLLQV